MCSKCCHGHYHPAVAKVEKHANQVVSKLNHKANKVYYHGVCV